MQVKVTAKIIYARKGPTQLLAKLALSNVIDQDYAKSNGHNGINIMPSFIVYTIWVFYWIYISTNMT